MFLPLELTLRPSRIYALVLAVVHVLALAGIWLAVMSVLVKALMTATLIASMIWSWRQNSRSPGALRVTRSGQLEMLDGEWRTAEIMGQPIVLPWMVSVVLMPKGGKVQRLMLWTDSANADGFRKLRVWFRWGRYLRS